VCVIAEEIGLIQGKLIKNGTEIKQLKEKRSHLVSSHICVEI
jgi:hypothetical protein